MIKQYQKLLLPLISAALAACASAPPLPMCSPSTSPRPIWIDSPPIDDVAYYGIGSATLDEGGSGQERLAQRRALADLAQSIEVVVDLDFQETLIESAQLGSVSSGERSSISQKRFSSDLVLADVKTQQRWQNPSDCRLSVLVSIAQDKAHALQALQAAERQYAIAADQDFPLLQRLSANQAASASLTQVDFLQLPSKPDIAYYHKRYSEQLELLQRLQARRQHSQFSERVQLVHSESGSFEQREQAFEEAQYLLTQIDFAHLALSAAEAGEQLSQAHARLQAQIAANRNLVLVLHRGSFDTQLLNTIIERLRAHELSGRELNIEVQNQSAALEIARSQRARQLQLIQIEQLVQALSSHANWSGKLQVSWSSIDLESGRQLAERNFSGLTIAQDKNLIDWSKTLINGVFRESG